LKLPSKKLKKKKKKKKKHIEAQILAQEQKEHFNGWRVEKIIFIFIGNPKCSTVERARSDWWGKSVTSLPSQL
jgi:hypothetical protein